MANCHHNQKEPYIAIDITIVVWKTVATDLFAFQDKTHVLLVDLFSRFPVAGHLHGKSTELVLDALKDAFSDFVIPETIISDNGLCYKRQECSTFCARFEITHITVASYNQKAD